MRVIKNYRDLDAWVRGMDLMDESDRIANTLPRFELYGLTSQIRRAALSIPANIAEGHGSFYRGKYIAALSGAHSELMELETLFEAAMRRGYVKRADLSTAYSLCGEVGRLIHGLANALMRRKTRFGESS